MSCNKCQSNSQVLPEGTVEAYDELISCIDSYHQVIASTNWDALVELKKAVTKKDYIKARSLLSNISEILNTTLSTTIIKAEVISTATANCLALPMPKGSIEFNSYVKRTYKAPTECKCATCKYCVTSELQEGVLLITKYACNYENKLTEAKQSGSYNKYEIFDQLSVDADGVCGCYEFGDQTDYDEIGDSLPESSAPGVADTSN